ncbi:hypothetical protein F6P74_06430 [Streptococcus suis]|uniref:hypothetical protein n=1 Tax=Streptococcus suis TaxID=1307 RepID=UPI001EE9798F|nr:hypothetical protein [Streptococcus suis]MBS8071164.1 hypothetical protein [Streptococcus suis]
MVKYALFSYSTENIGDEIQSIAASRFLPQIDYYINRDYMNDFKPDTDEQINTQLKSKIAEVQSLSTIDLS